MRVLVTGGTGFIGSHIVELLVDGGAEVRVLDLHAPREPSGLDARAELIIGDLRQPSIVRRAVVGLDAVCHQGAMVGLGVNFGDIGRYVGHNDVGTAVLLRALWQVGFRGRLVLASSMVVYGEGRARCADHGDVAPGPRRAEELRAGKYEAPCPNSRCDRMTAWIEVEEDSRVDPRNIYAATKLHQEHLCAVWGREVGATAVALRYHNVYGPRMPHDTPYAGVASIFRSDLVGGRAPQVFEDGGQTRDFVHVRDVARANVLALTGGDVGAGAYNVASGVPHTVGEMAAALAGAFGPGTPAPQVTGRWRLGDVRHVVASPRKAAERLGFVAEIGFNEGMVELAQAPGSGATSRIEPIGRDATR